jgi:hypothetical protein
MKHGLTGQLDILYTNAYITHLKQGCTHYLLHGVHHMWAAGLHLLSKYLYELKFLLGAD